MRESGVRKDNGVIGLRGIWLTLVELSIRQPLLGLPVSKARAIKVWCHEQT